MAAFDSKGKNFRHEIYEEYKANRSEMPDEIQNQLPYLWTLLEGMNIPVLRVDGVEADDIIGTVAKQCGDSDLQCNIVSGDKDFMQLINDSTFLYAPQARKKEKEIFDVNKVVEKWGVGPENIIDLLGLMGDSSDNVPGVQGVGPKTAMKLIQEYGNIENIYENIDSIKNEKMKDKLLSDKDNALLSKQLVTILTDVNIDSSVDDFVIKEMNTSKLEDIFKGALTSMLGACSLPHSWSCIRTPLLIIMMRLLCSPLMTGLTMPLPLFREETPLKLLRASPSEAVLNCSNVSVVTSFSKTVLLFSL